MSNSAGFHVQISTETLRAGLERLRRFDQDWDDQDEFVRELFLTMLRSHELSLALEREDEEPPRPS